MTTYHSSQHPLVQSVAWKPAEGAERINDHLLMSCGTSNSYLVTTADRDVVINTGMPFQGARHRERYEQALERPLKVGKIVLTQSHPDHIGGWSVFADAGSETIAQRHFPIIRTEMSVLLPYFAPRGARILKSLMPDPALTRDWQPGAFRLVEQPTLFGDAHVFEEGGRRFELISTPSGETLDSLVVWMPAERTVFTGNLFGALFGALPHFYTLRGDRLRSVTQFLRDIERVIALQPELLVTGHDEPIAGAARVAAELGKIRDAVRYLHDETVKGMNAGRDLWTLMRDIRLPPELEPRPGRGPSSWYVRSIWEEYAGWFRHESTTELYAVPASSVWGDLAELAGVDALTKRARAHLDAGRPLEALHLLDIALQAAPADRTARLTEIAALEALVERTDGRTFDELGWLETAIDQARAALGPS